MTKVSFKNKLISFLSLIILLSFFYIFNPIQTRASSEEVEFLDNVILNLEGLEEGLSLYITAGSKMGSLEISGKNASFDSIDSMVLRTEDIAVVFSVSSTNGNLDTSISSDHISPLGYLVQWEIDAITAVEGLGLGVAENNSWYAVKVNGVEIASSPFQSSDYKITFDVSEQGTYTIEEMDAPVLSTLNPINITENSATFRGNLTSLGGEGSTIDVWFEWDTDQELASPNITDIIEMTETGIFRQDISGLEKGETYYFRAVAENQDSGESSEGKTLSFVAIESYFIIVELGGKMRVIQIDREGRIIIQKEL